MQAPSCDSLAGIGVLVGGIARPDALPTGRATEGALVLLIRAA